MNLKLSLFCFFCFSIFSYSQVISGKVVDEKNNPLQGANIYFEGTSIGTISDQKGEFTLQINTKINSILLVSFMGFQTLYIPNYETLKDFKIILKPTNNHLREVVIMKDRFSRKQKLKLFREQFLGKTKLGKNAIIENETELYFEYNEKTNTFKAFSDKPLLIIHKALGYKIYYELADFEVNFTKTSISSSDVYKNKYSGYSRFEEIETTPKIINQRNECYEGSSLQFFRNLVNNVWDKDNFLLFVGMFVDNPTNHFNIIDEGNQKKVVVTKQKKSLVGKKFVAEFNLLYKKKDQSKIIFETDTFYVDIFGNNSNINDIYFSGHITQFKVGNMLPLNFIETKTP
jgi:hypothetical protein